jgi:transcriptional regulator with XRE-family HTH domain
VLRLQVLRERSGLSRNQLARLAGCPHGYVGQLELARIRPPADSRPLQRVALILGASSAGSLLELVDERADDPKAIAGGGGPGR